MGYSIAKLIVHPVSARLIDRIIIRRPQGILLEGEVGVGLRTIASSIAGAWAIHDTQVLIITPNEKGSIGIDPIKDLYRQLKTKQSSAQVIIIDDADTMSLDAQNALLKLLEEPPAHSHFVLTSHYPDVLLPTIMSRVQSISIRRVSTSESTARISSVTDPTRRSQITFLASGYPAETARLIDDEAYFEQQVQLMKQAREFITASSYDRLCRITKLSNDRERIETLLRMIGRLLVFSVDQRAKPSTFSSIEALEEATRQIQQNGNIKLHLTNLSLRLGQM